MKKTLRERSKEARESMNEVRFDKKGVKSDVTSDVKKAQELIKKGFVLIDGNTAMEHPDGGYIKLSKRVTNFFNKNNESRSDMMKKKRELSKKSVELAKTFKVGDIVDVKPEFKKHGKLKSNRGKVLKIYQDDGDLKVQDLDGKEASISHPAYMFQKVDESKSVKESIMFKQGDLLEWTDLMGILEDGKSIKVIFGYGENGTSFESSMRWKKYDIVKQRYGITLELENDCILEIMEGDAVKIEKARSDFRYHIEIEYGLSVDLDILPKNL